MGTMTVMTFWSLDSTQCRGLSMIGSKVALAEKLSALMTQEYLEERAKRGSRKKFDDAISKIKDRDPQPHDKLE